MLRSLPLRTMSALLTGAFVLAACSEAPTAMSSASGRPAFDVTNRQPELGQFIICADGATATFSITLTPVGGAPTLSNPANVTIPAGTCQVVHTNTLGAGQFERVTVTQISPATAGGVTCSSVANLGTLSCSGNVATFEVNSFHGAIAIFTNTASVPKGCTYTQGWYKNQGASTLPAGNFFLSGQTYLQVLNTPPKGGNVYYILAHQYIAASQNVKRIGGAPASVCADLARAKSYFMVATPNGPIPAGFTAAELNAIASRLDSFNNGNSAGYPHCD